MAITCGFSKLFFPYWKEKFNPLSRVHKLEANIDTISIFLTQNIGDIDVDILYRSVLWPTHVSLSPAN